MIDLRPNIVLHMKMNDNAPDPFVASLNGTPTQLIENAKFGDNSVWDWDYTAH